MASSRSSSPQVFAALCNAPAACVNILTLCRSIYRRQGDAADEMPEPIFLPMQDGLPDYLQWVADECES